MFNKRFLASLIIPVFLGSNGVFAESTFNPHYNLGSEASTATLGRAVTYQEVASEIEYHVFELQSHTPVHAAIRSSLIPGWGQGFNGQSIKGMLFFLTFAGTLTGSLIQYQNSNDSFDQYQATGQRNNALFDDHENERLQSTILGVAAGLIYGISIVDAYRNAYQPLWSRDISIDIAMTENEAQLIWKKKFQ